MDINEVFNLLMRLSCFFVSFRAIIATVNCPALKPYKILLNEFTKADNPSRGDLRLLFSNQVII
jgi:hypothetical protein